MNWTLSDGDNADFYFINITTNAPQTPYGGLLNITASASVILYELTGFKAGYQYNITVHGVNCLNQEGGESEPLIITPQSKSSSGHLFMHAYIYTGFKAGYEYSVTVHSICGSKKSRESKLLTINPQGIYIYIYIYIYI